MAVCERARVLLLDDVRTHTHTVVIRPRVAGGMSRARAPHECIRIVLAVCVFYAASYTVCLLALGNAR